MKDANETTTNTRWRKRDLMNYTDYIIGLGIGMVSTIIIRSIINSRKQAREALEEKERLHRKEHDQAYFKLCELRRDLENAFDRIKKLEGKKK